MKYNKILLNKILLIFVVFAIVVSACFSNVKASSTKYITANNVTYTLPDECTEYYIIFKYDGKIWLYFGNTPYWGVHKGSGYYDLFIYASDKGYGSVDNRLSCYQYAINLDSTDFSQPVEKYNRTWGYCCGSLENFEVLYSSVDIHDTFGGIFFQKTPVPVLVEVMSPEVVEKKTVQEILGVLPLITVVVVSFLGLRKVLKMLFSLLRRS